MEQNFSFEKEGNIASKLSDSAKKSIAEGVSKRWLNYTTQIQELIVDSREGWDFYLRNHPKLNNMADKSGQKLDSLNANAPKKGLRLGVIPRSVDSVTSILHNTMFPADERFFRGTPQNDVARSKQEITEQFLADNMAEANVTETLRKLLVTLAIDPVACLSVHYAQKRRKKVVYEAPKLTIAGIEIPLPVLGLKEKTIPNYIEWEGTVADVLDFNDFRVDPSARSMEDSPFIRRYYMPCWKVEKEFGLKDVKPYHTSFDDFTDDAIGNQKRIASGLTVPIPFEDEEEGKKNALLMVCYDDFMEDGKLYENHVTLILNGQDTIYFGPNDYNHGKIPYIVSPLISIPGQIYGLSLIKHAIPSAAVIDTAVDKILKIGSLAADPIFEVDMMEPAFRKSKAVKPGMTIPVKRLGSIRQVQVNVANLNTLMEVMSKAEDNIREVTGASPVFTGEDFAQQPSNVTAFQVDQHVQGANSRFQGIIGNFTNSFLEQFMYMTFENFKQFKEKTETIYVGDTEHELTPDLLKQMDFKWLITGANATNTRAKKLANLKSLFMEIMPPMLQAGIVNLSPEGIQIDQGEALKELLILGGTTNADQLIKVMPIPPQQPGAPNGLQQPVPGGGGQLPPQPPGQPGIPPA